jgi:hypothetical protein
VSPRCGWRSTESRSRGPLVRHTNGRGASRGHATVLHPAC